MDHMEVGDVVQEEPALRPEEVTVNRCGSAPLEVPLAVAVVGELHVGVMEVRDHDKPAKRITVEHRARTAYDMSTHQWVTSSQGMP